MTKSGANGPKARARARQTRDGRKYTQALRNGVTPLDPGRSPAVPSRTEGLPSTFQLQELLAECTTLPAVGVETPEERITFGFRSEILGRVIPFGAALSLAGALSREGLDTELAAESATEGSIVITSVESWSDQRRWQMSLFDDWTTPLCPAPYCSHHSIDYNHINRCHTHLAACDSATLIRIAKWWAQGHSDSHDADPERLGGDRKAKLLVEAAVGQGAGSKVIEALLGTLFMHEDDIEEAVWDEAEALTLRHAIGLERLRLNRVARDEARRIRRSTVGCPSCGKGPVVLADAPPYPPQFCSPQCAVVPPQGVIAD
ncbi:MULTISPECIES: hypothetical protein [unclassified Streptomyces]|uniref:hypothetical protein n=1 Tax=unclassified Streptomyces TaxID=2593676 RepID=UPI000A5188A9|nr:MULTISPECIES: hypothetical protein [unclassified Streptomyces]MCR8942326.1 hypothetical protein [Streptomyces sp. OUCMDZ-4982]